MDPVVAGGDQPFAIGSVENLVVAQVLADDERPDGTACFDAQDRELRTSVDNGDFPAIGRDAGRRDVPRHAKAIGTQP